MSGDDELFPNSIEVLLDHAEKNNGEWTYGGLDVINEYGELITQWTYEGFPESVEQAITYMLIRGGLGTTFGALFSTKFLNGKTVHRFPNTNFSLDAATAVHWYGDYPKICRVGKQVLRYRVHKGGRSYIHEHERAQMQKDLYAELLQIFGARYLSGCLEGK
jgi:hypothetical protein